MRLWVANRVIREEQWARYEQLRKRGWGMERAAREAGFNPTTAWRREKKRRGFAPSQRASLGEGRFRNVPIPYAELKPEAQEAWNDFGVFQRRYFGRIATPWQVEAAEIVRGWIESPDKEFGVVNAPPGSGKSTTFTHDIPAWLTVRNRGLRGQIGSKTDTKARWYVKRLRRSFERTMPWVNEADDVGRGLALDAVATLGDDFGTFRPEDRDTWSADAFVVAQADGRLTSEKEPTWSAAGRESAFLGMRYQIIIWDDLVDKQSLRNEEARLAEQEWWDDIAEKRLEPGGVLILQGQRMGAADLYRYTLDKRLMVDDEDDGNGPPKYHHIVFKAHYEDRCDGQHSREAPYYPEGCLLDPRRVSWRDLKAEMANPRRNYAVIYQQEDSDPENVLVDPLWVNGGTDSHGSFYPGCKDPKRVLCQLPGSLAGDLLSIATADPSPTKFWSVQWWIVRCVDGEAHERYLMDLERRGMTAADFLDWNESTRSFTGLMEEWQARSHDLNLPIQTWIVEKNGAQRFMLQYDHMRRWLAHWRVDLWPHETTRNKADPEFGVQVLSSLYKHGLVRLPWRANTPAKLSSMKLVEEVTKYPGYTTDDCVMAQWFLEWRLPALIPTAGSLPRFSRPSWLKDASTYNWRDQWRKPLYA